MANNHGADYGSDGLSQTLAAIRSSGFPVVGIGADATAAYAPYYTTVRGPVEHPARPLRLSTSGGCQTLPVHIRHA